MTCRVLLLNQFAHLWQPADFGHIEVTLSIHPACGPVVDTHSVGHSMSALEEQAMYTHDTHAIVHTQYKCHQLPAQEAHFFGLLVLAS